MIHEMYFYYDFIIQIEIFPNLSIFSGLSRSGNYQINFQKCYINLYEKHDI